MSKKVDLSKPLSPEDRQYLMDRGRVAEVEANEAEHGKQSGMTKDQRQRRIADIMAELRQLEEEQNREDNPNEANPTPGIGGGVRDNTVVDGKRPTDATPDLSDDYEDERKWNKAKLVDELKGRNREREENNLPLLRTTGTRSELVEELRRDDQEIASSGE